MLVFCAPSYDNTAAHQWVAPDGRTVATTGSAPSPGVGWEQLKEVKVERGEVRTQ
jgi:hypothetical protein